MDIIEIRGLRVCTEVGFSAHEVGKLQELQISIRLQTSIKAASKTDRVQDTINNRKITKDVLLHVESKKYNLIETVATDVARICVVRHCVPWVKVTVETPNALRFTESSAVEIERRSEDFDWEHFHISIGSNIDPLTNIPKALGLLEGKVQITKVSKMFQTAPVGYGCSKHDDFVNMAAVITTKLHPQGLKQVLLDVENRLGRVRDPSNQSNQITIDLDITFWEQNMLEFKLTNGPSSKTWYIPEPDTLTYAHVIIPLADVTPDFIHPQVKKPLRLIAEEVSGQTDFCAFFPRVQPHPVHSGLACLEITNDSTVENRQLPSKKPEHSNVDKVSTDTEPGSPDTPNDFFSASKSPVALVTGAAKRLGACIVRGLHAAGYNIVVHFNTSVSQATHLVEDLNRIRGDSAQLIQGDLSCDISGTADRIIKGTLEAWGRLDVLINNASQFYPTDTGNTSEKAWNNLMAVNLCAPFFLSQAAYPSLKESQGCVVNLLDIHGERPLTGRTVYCISKAGLQMCTLALAREFAPHVRVNGVAPGAILWQQEAGKGHGLPEDIRCCKETDIAEQEKILAKIPFGRVGKPTDIADTVVFLAKSAAYITGQVIHVDGGWTLNQ